MPDLAIVDIDGVVAAGRHRLHHIRRKPKDWKRFFADAAKDLPHPEGLAIVERLAQDHEVVFLTGRPIAEQAATQAWLERHGLAGHRLVMRPARDFRPAAVVKVELLAELARGRRVAVVVDDDPDVIAAMEAAGHPTLLADWEPRAPEQEATLRTAQEREGRT